MVSACGSIDPEAELAAAQASLDAGDFRTASLHAGNVLQAAPENAGARVIRASIALYTGDYATAVAEYEAARARGAALPHIALERAEAQLGEGDVVAAQSGLEAVESVFTGDPDYWALVAEARLAAQKYEAAAEALARAREMGGRSARIALVQAGLALTRNDIDQAEAVFDEAAVEFSDDPRVHSARGQLYLRTQRLTEAREAFRMAVDAYGNRGAARPQVSVLLVLAQVALAENDNAALVEAADRLTAIAPEAGFSYYAQGLVAYQAGRFGDAVGLAQQAVNDQPEAPSFATLLGAAHLGLGNLGQAELQLRRAVTLAPNDPAAAKLLAETRLRLQRPEEALDVLRPLQNLGITDPQVGLLAGIANLQSGNTERGIAALAQAGVIESPELELALFALQARMRANDVSGSRDAANSLVQAYPTEPRALTAAALFHLEQDEQERGDALLDRAIAARRDYIPARIARAQRLARDGQLDGAAAELQTVAEIVPDAPAVKLAQGRLELERGRGEPAREYLSAANALNPGQADTLVLLAQAELMLGNVDTAVGLADQLNAIAPDRSVSYLVRAEAEIARRRYDAAAMAYEEAFARNPVWSVRLRWINALMLAGDDAAVLTQYLAAAEDDPDNIVALNNASWLLHEAGRAAEALPLAEQANALVPGNAAILDTLGWILVGLNRERDAIAHLEQAVALAPDAPEIRYHLAVAQARGGRTGEARQQLELLLATEEPFEQRAQAEDLFESL